MNFSILHTRVRLSPNLQIEVLVIIIRQAKAYGVMPYSCFIKLYNALVLPIITYGSAIWGDKSYSHIDAVHDKVCRFFLVVVKYTPNATIQGWPLPMYHLWATIVKQCQRLNLMSENRIIKTVFMFCKSHLKAQCKLW